MYVYVDLAWDFPGYFFYLITRITSIHNKKA